MHRIKRLILFHPKRHSRDMGAAKIEAFLTHTWLSQRRSPLPPRTRPSPPSFFFIAMSQAKKWGAINALHTKLSQYLSTILSKDEVTRLLDRFTGVHALLARPFYGSSMRPAEGLRPRVKERS